VLGDIRFVGGRSSRSRIHAQPPSSHPYHPAGRSFLHRRPLPPPRTRETTRQPQPPLSPAGGGHGGVGTGSTPLPSSDGAPSSRPRSASPFRDRGEPRAAAMSKVFEGCERQYCVAAASLSRKCTAASALDGGKQASRV